jgi:hypothetical protein
MKRLLLWAFLPVILVFWVLAEMHTGPTSLWAGLAAGVLVLWVLYLAATGRLSAAGRR